MRGIRRRDAMFYHLRRGYRLSLRGANSAAEANGRPVPCCFGFNRKEKCQQTEAKGERRAPAEQRIGERSRQSARHSGSLTRGRHTENIQHLFSNFDFHLGSLQFPLWLQDAMLVEIAASKKTVLQHSQT
jgi:hypothetical protein